MKVDNMVLLYDRHYRGYEEIIINAERVCKKLNAGLTALNRPKPMMLEVYYPKKREDYQGPERIMQALKSLERKV